MRVEVDELWSFIGEKAEVWWVWLAQDSRTRQVVAMAVGDRDEFTARCLWESLPPEYRERTIVATDHEKDRHAVGQCVEEARGGVARARPGDRERRRHFAARPAIAVGQHRGPLLVSDQKVCDSVTRTVEGIVQGNILRSRHPENGPHFLSTQTAKQDVGTGQ